MDDVSASGLSADTKAKLAKAKCLHSTTLKSLTMDKLAKGACGMIASVMPYDFHSGYLKIIDNNFNSHNPDDLPDVQFCECCRKTL